MNFSCVKSTLTQENLVFTLEVLCLKVTASYAWKLKLSNKNKWMYKAYVLSES